MVTVIACIAMFVWAPSSASHPVDVGDTGVPWYVTIPDLANFSVAAIGDRIGEIFGTNAEQVWDEALTHAQVVELDMSQREGVSDSGTIALNTSDLTLDEAAVVAYHEADHSNDAAAVSDGDPNTPDPDNQGPCGPCNHAQQHFDELSQLSARDCTPELSFPGLCLFFAAATKVIDKYMSKCAASQPPCESIPPIKGADVPPMCSCGT